MTEQGWNDISVFSLQLRSWAAFHSWCWVKNTVCIFACWATLIPKMSFSSADISLNRPQCRTSTVCIIWWFSSLSLTCNAVVFLSSLTFSWLEKVKMHVSPQNNYCCTVNITDIYSRYSRVFESQFSHTHKCIYTHSYPLIIDRLCQPGVFGLGVSIKFDLLHHIRSQRCCWQTCLEMSCCSHLRPLIYLA